MTHLKHTVQLTDHQRRELKNITDSGKRQSRVLKRAAILLKSDEGLTDKTIATHVGVHWTTVRRVRLRYVNEGLQRALYDAPRSGQPPILNDRAEAQLVAIACSHPPEGRMRWTLELLQERLLEDGIVAHISLQAVSEHLRERGIKPWREKNVVRSKH